MQGHDFKKYPELTNNKMDIYYFESPHKQITRDFTALVVDVHDGDTIKLRWHERDFDFPLRMIPNAAPELDEMGGFESQAWLEKKILNKEVEIIIDEKNRVEKYGRLLGRVFSNGMDIGEESIAMGKSIKFGEGDDSGIIPDDNDLWDIPEGDIKWP